MHQSFLTTSLTYGPLDEQGRSLVTLLCDHRVVDGIVAARALADLETAMNGPIARRTEIIGRIARGGLKATILRHQFPTRFRKTPSAGCHGHCRSGHAVGR